jgi:pyruvate-formate lyase-activating enzyme
MSKRHDESFIDYRKRLMDPISTSFCAAKWYNATIWLGSGTTTSCHHPLGHVVDPVKVLENPKLLHNTPHKKECRRQMQQGERPKECEYCWKIEDMKRDNVSDRVFKTVIYDEHDIAFAARLDPQADVNLKTLEIAFDRTCNFACSYCNPAFSTTWASDVREKGPYQNLVSDGRNHFTHPHDGAQPYKHNEENPYIQAFWKWWPELSESLTELRVTGGEPLMSPDVWRLIEFFEKNGPGKMALAINSNLGAKDEIIDRFVEKSHHIGTLDVYTSNESLGPHAEYIRDGLTWDRWSKNFEKLLGKGKFRQVHVMMTINSLCLFSITDFMDYLLEQKTRFGHGRIHWSVNLLRFPSFQSCLALPADIRTERKEHLEKWLEDHKYDPRLHEMEVVSLQRLVDYLDVVKTPHQDSSPREELERDFKKFFQQYDARRGKNFEKSFSNSPSLLEWYRNIKV